MRNAMRCGPWSVVMLGCAALVACSHSKNSADPAQDGWQQEFTVNKADLSSTGTSRYFRLEPGNQLVFGEGKDTLTITVLNETKMVDGVETRVIEEREMKDGKPAEISRNYFAIDKKTGDVYYFGEDVDIYKNGKVASHEGAWLSGVKGAKFGLMMPGEPKVGQRFYQEQAPGVATDRAEIASTSETVTTPAGTFRDCVKTNESSSLESGTAHKWYAPGVGLIKDGDEFILVKIGNAGQ